MSKYTTEVRYICEKYAGLDVSADYLSIGEVIERARGTIFNFYYPIFDESYRSVLETKILKHFYTREIGEETVGLWKLRLETRMNEIMPYYNQRYASELITFNPLFDTDLTTSRDDTFGSQKRDDNIHNTVNGGQDINDNHLVKDITDGGTDTKRLSGADANEEGGNTKLKYLGKARRDHKGDDTDTYQDIKDGNKYPSTESTTDSWHNVNTVDMHFESDTPQSTIASIDDNNYATAFTKDVHTQKNASGLDENSDNFERVKETIEHREHHSNTTHYNSYYEDSFTDRIDQTEHGKTDTTYYGKVDSTTYGKTEDTDQSIHDVLQFGKTTRFDERNKQDFNSTDKWLEKMVGKRNSKSYSQMLNEFRTTFLNIDMEIINELNDLFFNLW